MTDVVKGHGDVFADLKVADSEMSRLKTELVRRIASLINERRLTQNAAAARIGLSQSDVSKILQGRPVSLSLERSFRCLVALGQTVTIEVGPPENTRPSIRLTVR
jgi:predicted XRE-type DNA-binding protein